MHTMRRRLAVIAMFAVCATALAVVVPSAGGAGDVRPSVGQKAVAWAVDHVGVREIGTTNCSPTIDRWERDMGLRLPPCRVWCGAFVHQAYLRAGVRLSKRLIDPHRSYADAVARRRHLRKIAVSGTFTVDDPRFSTGCVSDKPRRASPKRLTPHPGAEADAKRFAPNIFAPRCARNAGPGRNAAARTT